MKWGWLRHAVIVGLCLMIFVVLFIKTQKVDNAGHEHMIGTIHDLTMQDAALNQNIIRTHHGMLGNYDPFVRAIAESRELQSDLMGNPSTLYRKGLPEVDKLTADVRMLLDKKEALLESFKSKNAILKNSLRYFPSIVAMTIGDEAEDHGRIDGELKSELSDLAVDILDYSLSGSDDVRMHASDHADEILEKLNSLSKEDRANVELILLHANIIVRQKPAVDSLAAQLLSLPTTQVYGGLNTAYDEEYGRVVREANQYRFFLYLFPTLLLAYIAYVLLRLKKNTTALHDAVEHLELQKIELTESREKLRQFNKELEKRVQERTVELDSTNAQLVYYLEDITRKNEENEMFVYSVSHDLRSPLVNLQGFSQELVAVSDDIRKLIEQCACSEEIKKRGLKMVEEDMGGSIRFIQAGVVRLSNIMDALLRLSRAGRVEYQIQHVDLDPIISRIVSSMQSIIAQRGATLTIQPLPAAWGDPTAIEQIFANLIGNALNYLNPKRPGLIEVGCRPEPETTANATLNVYYVKDNGLGISEQAKSKLFKIFQRMHPDAAKGEGVGLAIVRRMVERHGGRITVESTEGEGTTFIVTLPAEQIKQAPIFSTSEQATLEAELF